MFLSVLNKIKKRWFGNIWFKRDFTTFKKGNDGRFDVDWKNRFPCLNDKTTNTSFDAHYIYHPAWAARILRDTKPERHIDFSSTLHFSTIVSAFIPIEFFDFRPATLDLSGLLTRKADVTNLSFSDNSIKSLSCMHTVEHIGLGRYGDPIDPAGDLKAMNELQRVLANGGDLLFVVPVGHSMIVFNAHRIYSYDQIINYFKDLKLNQFSLVIDSGEFIMNADPQLANQQNYGCGCFWFKK